MRDKDYEADFAAGTTWRDWIYGIPFLVIGKTIALGINTYCRVKGHKFINHPDYCERCSRHFPNYDDNGPDLIISPRRFYKRPKED